MFSWLEDIKEASKASGGVAVKGVDSPEEALGSAAGFDEHLVFVRYECASSTYPATRTCCLSHSQHIFGAIAWAGGFACYSRARPIGQLPNQHGTRIPGYTQMLHYTCAIHVSRQHDCDVAT